MGVGAEEILTKMVGHGVGRSTRHGTQPRAPLRAGSESRLTPVEECADTAEHNTRPVVVTETTTRRGGSDTRPQTRRRHSFTSPIDSKEDRVSRLVRHGNLGDYVIKEVLGSMTVARTVVDIPDRLSHMRFMRSRDS